MVGRRVLLRSHDRQARTLSPRYRQAEALAQLDRVHGRAVRHVDVAVPEHFFELV